MRGPGFALIAIVSLACEGSGIDTITRSNCPWSADQNFYNQGYNLYHQRPDNCPIPITISHPWFATPIQYGAVVTGPHSAVSMSTSYYNANYQFLVSRDHIFFDYASGTRADVSDTYPAASIEVTNEQERSDHALTVPYPGPGTGLVDLTYKGTLLIATLPSSAEQGQYVDMYVYPQGDELVAPITYQWYADGTAIGGPTQSNTIETQLNNAGTITIRVVATDANGQVAEAKNWINVSEPCGPNAC